MGNRKRNPSQKLRNPPSSANNTDISAKALSLDGIPTDRSGDCNSKVDFAPSLPPPPSLTRVSVSSDVIKEECEKALLAFRRGNHTKALRLMKEACVRHKDSSALLHRVHGTIFVKVAGLIDDQNVKSRHLRNAIESARKAVAMSPDSVEFTYFYANLLYDTASDSKAYEEVVHECERALAIENPIDPAMESLQDLSQQKLVTAEERIAHVHQDIRSLIQKANISSISMWMKNLGNGAGTGVGGVGDDKIRLIPMRKLSDDPMEIRVVQSAKRPNEIKKASKTPEERRKEIEVRVAAARLMQQKNSNPTTQKQSQNEDEQLNTVEALSTTNNSTSHRVGERRKMNNGRKHVSSTERMDKISSYWNSMSSENKKRFLEVNVQDLQMQHVGSKDTLANDLLSEALSFVKPNQTWNFWVCCRCREKFTDVESHLQHVENEHVGSLTSKLQSVLPQEVDADWVDKIVNDNWKPIDAFGAAKMIEDERFKYQSLTDIDYDDGSKDRESLFDYWSSKESKADDDFCSGLSLGKRENYHSDFDTIRVDNDFSHRWPLSDDSERKKLLERIHGVFQLLARNKCLSAGHLNKLIQFTMDELQGLPYSSQLMKVGLDQSPLCICFLEASHLRKVLKFLQDLSHSCGLGRYAESNIIIDDTHTVSQENEFLNNIVLSCDATTLHLDHRLFWNKDASENCGPADDIDKVDTNKLVSWLLSGMSSGDQLVSWTISRDEKTQQGLENLQMLEKDFYLLQNMCERKCEHLNYEEALHRVENLCLEEFKKREQASTVTVTANSYDTILRKRREDLVERESDTVFNESRLEMDAISNVLKESQSLNSTQFGYDKTLTGTTSRLCELECSGEDEWRVQDLLHQADSCVETAIQRQKEHVSIEISKIDARIMRNLTGIEQLEQKLGPSSAFDYRGVVLPIVKSFMRAYLEDLVDKDATEKSDAAREAFLAELARDAKKNASKGGEQSSKNPQEKTKDKKKNKDHRKPKDTKASTTFACNGEVVFHQETSERTESLVTTEARLSEIEYFPSKGDLKLKTEEDEEEEIRRKTELEAEERKLEETLEYQRKMENEAKQKHIEEQIKRTSGVPLQNMSKKPSHVYLNTIQDSNGELAKCNHTNLSDTDSSASGKGIGFGDFHFPEITHSTAQSMKFDPIISNHGKSDLLVNKDPQAVTHHHKEKSSEIIKGEHVTGLNQNGKMVNHLEGDSVSEVSFTTFFNQRTNKANTRSHSKNKRGSSEIFQDGNLPHETRLDRHFNKSSNSKRIANGSPKAELEKENNIDGPSQNVIHNKGHSHKKIIDNSHGESRRARATNLKIAKEAKIAEAAKNCLEASIGENGSKTLRELHAEDDDEERFQEDLKKAVRQSLDTYEAHKNFTVAQVPRLMPKVAPVVDNDKSSDVEVIEITLNRNGVLGTGLKNEAGEYNCFLNVIIQSLWHLRRFRNEFLAFSPKHMHVGSPCVVCALYEIFNALSMASMGDLREPVAPTSLRSALSNLYPNSNFFQEAQMNDASEVLAVLFDCLHRSVTSSSSDCDTGSEESNCLGSWDCSNSSCIAHHLFGMDVFEQMNCQKCGLESRHLKYTTFFHNVNANALRTTKITCADSSFAELLNHVEMNHQVACDRDAGGCGKPNYIHHIFSRSPHVFTIVLGWQTMCENPNDISSTLAAITTELDIGVIYRGLDFGNKHELISVVCYYGQHYHCFAYNNECKQWFLYDDKMVKVVGSWDDVLSMCVRGHLQPQVLFFEAVN